MIRRCVWAAFTLAATAQQRQTIDFEDRQKGQPVRVTVEIHWPAVHSVVPAMVLGHGSGGIWVPPRASRVEADQSTVGVAASRRK